MSTSASPADRLAALCATALLCLLAAPVSAAVQLEGLRLHEAPEYTRVVFDISSDVTYSLFTLDNPRRVVIDLSDARAAPGFEPDGTPLTGDRVRGIRGSVRGAGYRVVLDVSDAFDPRAFTLAPVSPYGHRLVVDLLATVRAARPEIVAKPEGRRDVIVAIDAGHGGEDPGAIGPRGIREKDVVMQVAKRLKAKIDAETGYRAVMVRTGDYYLAHRKRLQAARTEEAHLFVSLHADAFKIPSVAGASVYTLSNRGASSETARWLAEKENNADRIGGELEVDTDDQEDWLYRTLLEVSMDASRSASIEVGEDVLQRLGGVTRLHKKRVEQAGFLVLKSPDIPSILVEMGFISNPDEARRLASGAYQEQLASALFAGIRDYMSARAPEGTLIAWRREQGQQQHTIGRGDTLSGIAVKYGTSARRIKEANGLSSDRIRVGQVLTIPAG